MSSSLFKDYQDSLRQTLEHESFSKVGSSHRIFEQLHDGRETTLDKGSKRFNVLRAFKDINYLSESTVSTISGEKQAITFNHSELENLFGKNPDKFEAIDIGDHPDFRDLRHNEELNHHCVSAFIDIKGSTKLVNKYSLQQVRYIKDTMLTLCIYISNFFGGHVQRLQGDGIFVQFVRRDRYARDAIINALNATSIILQFVKVDLASILEDQGIDPLKVRVGIDYGNDEDVLWSHYGIPNCSELTTTSLHTDLAAKLQARARSNRILIGGNVKDVLDLPESFLSIPEKRGSSTGKDYYIMNDPRYSMYEFSWENYLNTFQFFRRDINGIGLIFEQPQVYLECEIAPKDSQAFEIYNQNLFAIPKEHDIRFRIKKDDRYVTTVELEESEWKARNTGKEAEEAKQLVHDFGGDFNNKDYCKTSSAYLGHHIAECKIKRKFMHSKEKLTFPIFVKEKI
jgi:adenylate cyclase